jgi:hypothetical protein
MTNESHGITLECSSSCIKEVSELEVTECDFKRRTVPVTPIDLSIRIFSLTPAVQLATLTANKGDTSNKTRLRGVRQGKKADEVINQILKLVKT